MGESQSRYSIVADLTNIKLDIITALSNLENDVKIAEQKVEELKEEKADYEASQVDEGKRIRREKDRAIIAAQRESKNMKDKQETKKKAYQDKIKVITEALDKIQAISDAAAKEASK